MHFIDGAYAIRNPADIFNSGRETYDQKILIIRPNYQEEIEFLSGARNRRDLHNARFPKSFGTYDGYLRYIGLNAQDETYFLPHCPYQKQTIFIDVTGHKWDNFRMSDEEKVALMTKGYKAVEAYFAKPAQHEHASLFKRATTTDQQGHPPPRRTAAL